MLMCIRTYVYVPYECIYLCAYVRIYMCHMSVYACVRTYLQYVVCIRTLPFVCASCSVLLRGALPVRDSLQRGRGLLVGLKGRK